MTAELQVAECKSWHQKAEAMVAQVAKIVETFKTSQRNCLCLKLDAKPICNDDHLTQQHVSFVSGSIK